MKDNSPIIGDLVEEYREVVRPARGRVRATLWFARQLASLVPPWVWGGILLGTAFVARNALDTLAPPVDFYLRSAVLTYVLAGILLASGAWASLRSGTLISSALAGIGTAAVAAVVSAIGTACLLTLWHDATVAMIRATGGSGETLAMPVLLVILGAIGGTIGGAAGAVVRRLRMV